MEIKKGNVYLIDIFGAESTVLVLGSDGSKYRVVYLGDDKEYSRKNTGKNPLSVLVNNEEYYLTGDENLISHQHFIKMLSANHGEKVKEYIKMIA